MVGGTTGNTKILSLDYSPYTYLTAFGGSSQDSSITTVPGGSTCLPFVGVTDQSGTLIWAKQFSNIGGKVSISNVKFERYGNYVFVLFDETGANGYLRMAYMSATTGGVIYMYKE